MTEMLRLSQVCWAPPRYADILHDVSLSVPSGQFVAVCGANGAGKSTLLRLIYRYQRPGTGQVHLEGRDIWGMSAKQTARIIAAVLQEQPTDFALSVRQIVSLGRLPHRRGWGSSISSPGLTDAVVIDESLKRMDLVEMSDRRFSTLSGGERQRVMVARALAQEPRLLVLDEPTNHLDIRHQLELLSLLRGLGLTVVTTLHDLGLAAEFTDRIILLHQGRVLSDGPPAEALSEAHLAIAFNVRSQIDRSGSHPRFSFHL
jgi:iron complex transport system ATP-binding protein